MWPLMLMRFEGCSDVAIDVDEILERVEMWPLRLKKLKGLS